MSHFFLNENVCFAISTAKKNRHRERRKTFGNSCGLIFLFKFCSFISLTLMLAKKNFSLAFSFFFLSLSTLARTLWLLLFIQLFQARIFIEEKFPSTFLSLFSFFFWSFENFHILTHNSRTSWTILSLNFKSQSTWHEIYCKKFVNFTFSSYHFAFRLSLFLPFFIHHSFFPSLENHFPWFPQTFSLFLSLSFSFITFSLFSKTMKLFIETFRCFCAF